MDHPAIERPGPLALVGSGEYLPEMAELEGSLLRSAMERGKLNRFVQLPLAAGRESTERLKYWQELGASQAQRLATEQVFLPIYTREDAMRSDLAKEIDNAGLIYISGGDPSYLATSLAGTPVWEAIERNWRAGSALAGCSAGAMALSADIPNFRKQSAPGTPGLNVLPTLRTIPHYNKFFGWIPDGAAKLMVRAPEGVSVIGVDELTAAVAGLDEVTTISPPKFKVFGVGAVHVLRGSATHKYHHGELVELH
jgi:cyanophycinase-like exopeptidase